MSLTKREIERASKLQKKLSSRKGLIGRAVHPPKSKSKPVRPDSGYDGKKISKMFRENLAEDIARTKRILRRR